MKFRTKGIVGAVLMLLVTFNIYLNFKSSVNYGLIVECNNNVWKGKIMTVQGLIPADSLGVTLPHEHLLIRFSHDETDLDDEEIAISELEPFINAGGKSLVEVTSVGLGRNPQGLKRISEASGANVIMGAGFYKKYWLKDSVQNKSIEEFANVMISDVVKGENGVHAGVIGEIGIHKSQKKWFNLSSNPFGTFENKLLIACAIAQNATGASIIIHFDIDESAKNRNYALKILEDNSADLSRVSISHCTPYLNEIEELISFAKKGCYIAFDNLGLENHKPYKDLFYPRKLEVAKTIKALINKGYVDHILISQDVFINTLYVKNGGNGYAHILNNIIPELKTEGVTDEQIKTIVVENPKRLLSF